jgi:hypothetical protein
VGASRAVTALAADSEACVRRGHESGVDVAELRRARRPWAVTAGAFRTPNRGRSLLPLGQE